MSKYVWATLAAGFLISQPAFAFSHCPGVLPDPVWPIKTQILQVEEHARSYGGDRAPPEMRACAYYQHALLLQFAGTPDKAIEYYTHAIGLMNTFADAFAARGDAYADLGQHDKAAEDYAALDALGPVDGPMDLNGRCWVRAVRGRPLDLALADCNESLRGDMTEKEKSAALDTRCFVYFRMGNYAAAIADCDTALKLDQSSTGSLYVRDLAKLRSGDAAGGNADIARAQTISHRIAEEYAVWGVKP